MSAYSMPLCTILTKCPAPSGPTCTQHGVPSTCAAIDSKIGPSVRYDSAEPPGMMLGPFSAPFLAAGHAGADEVQPARAQVLLAAAGVGEVGVAAVDDDVAGVEQRDQLGDHRVGGLAGLDHDDDRPRPLQRGDEVRHRLAGTNVPSWPCSATRLRVRSNVRLCSATRYPCLARLLARLRPMTASPVTPICAAL